MIFADRRRKDTLSHFSFIYTPWTITQKTQKEAERVQLSRVFPAVCGSLLRSDSKFCYIINYDFVYFSSLALTSMITFHTVYYIFISPLEKFRKG